MYWRSGLRDSVEHNLEDVPDNITRLNVNRVDRKSAISRR